MKKILILLPFLFWVEISLAGLGITPDSFVVIGDSFSDTGNQFEFFSQPGNTPAGFPYSPPYFDGRLSNGPVWIERVASSYGLTVDAATPFGPAIDGETNFAWSGAPTDDLSNPLFPPGMLQQTDYFITNLATYASVNPSTTLFTVFGGGNDSFLLTSGSQMEIEAVAGTAAANIRTIIENLYAIGGREFLIPNQPGASLAELYAFDIIPNPSIGLDYAQAFNQALSIELDTARMNLADINIIELDIFSLTQSILVAPNLFGITDVTNPCVTFGANSTLLGSCSNPEDFYFFDSLHPSSTGHELWAQAALGALVPIPPAVLLFGSSLFALVSFARRQKK